MSNRNQNIKFQLSEIDIDSTNDKIEEEIEQSNNDASRPIPSLIEYIKEKYDKDASEQLSEYESIINKERKNE